MSMVIMLNKTIERIDYFKYKDEGMDCLKEKNEFVEKSRKEIFMIDYLKVVVHVIILMNIEKQDLNK
jgi:hypothetical protein